MFQLGASKERRWTSYYLTGISTEPSISVTFKVNLFLLEDVQRIHLCKKEIIVYPTKIKYPTAAHKIKEFFLQLYSYSSIYSSWLNNIREIQTSYTDRMITGMDFEWTSESEVIPIGAFSTCHRC